MQTKTKNHIQGNKRLIKLQLPFQKKDNAFASHAFRKICSAVKKAALFERPINGSLFNHHTIMNTTKATPDHHKCEFAAFRLSKFFFPSATGVWGH